MIFDNLFSLCENNDKINGYCDICFKQGFNPETFGIRIQKCRRDFIFPFSFQDEKYELTGVDHYSSLASMTFRLTFSVFAVISCLLENILTAQPQKTVCETGHTYKWPSLVKKLASERKENRGVIDTEASKQTAWKLFGTKLLGKMLAFMLKRQKIKRMM